MNFGRAKGMSGRAALLLGASLIAAPAAAQVGANPGGAPPEQAGDADNPTQSPNSNQDVGEPTEDVVVTGVRASLEDALQTKRNSIQVLDSISAENIGKLPDQNLAESLQRLPGVQINRSAQRRLGTVSIRGLPGDFSQTLINGQYLASPDVSNFSFGTVRSEVFGGIDVVKAVSASDLSGGLSGLVNLRTGDPLTARSQLSISVDGKYEELTEDVAPGGAVVFSRKFAGNTLGVRAAFGYQKLNFREDNAQINTYDRVAGAATAALADDVYAPRQARLASNDTRGDSYSAAATVQWRPFPAVDVSIRGFYNDFRPETYQPIFTIESRPTSVRTALDTLDEGAFGRTQYNVRVTNPLLIADSRVLDQRYKTYALTGNTRYDANGWLLDATVHYTRATRASANYGYQAQQQALNTGTNGLAFTLNTGKGSLGDFAYDLTSGSPRINLRQPFGAPFAPAFREVRATTAGATNQSFFGGFRNEDEKEDELALSLALRRDVDFGPIKSVEVGGAYRDKSQAQDNSLQSLFGANIAALTNDVYDFSFLNGSGAFMDGKIGGFDPADIAELDVNRITGLIRPATTGALPGNGLVGPGGLVAIVDTTSLSLIYDNVQDIYGGYALVNLEQPFGPDFTLRGNLGVRYEEGKRSTLSRDGQGRPTINRFKSDNWLPSANLVLEGPGDVIIRGSYNRSVRRPQVDSFAVLRSIAVDGTGGLITVNLGASDLRPFTSDNYDLAVEWYNRRGSTVSALFFRKEVKDFAGTTRVCPADGGGFGFGPLSTASGVCRTTQATPASGLFPAVLLGATANINVTANQSDFTLSGYELSVQQNLDFLPAPFNGFGGQVNYTRVNFTTASTSFRLSEISKHTVNAIVYYETERFGLRAAYNFRSKYFLASGTTATGADRFVEARPQLDLTGSLNITERFSANFELFNVTNEELYEYEGAETRARNYAIYGRTLRFGLNYRL